MTRYEREQVEIMIMKHGRKCKVCSGRYEGRAHLVPQREWVIKKYGRKVIHHHSNILPSCNNCNNSQQLSSWEWEEKVENIKKELAKEGLI